MLTLEAAAYKVTIDPTRGGSVATFEYSGQPIFRPSSPGSMLRTACFPLVPFSNRIADGAFSVSGTSYQLPPNFPEADTRSALHGYGWLSEWGVVSKTDRHAVIEHIYSGSAWPWRYHAVQAISLDARGATFALEVENLDRTAMPAGLGFHPYFPRDQKTRYRGLHRGEWQVDAECLPQNLISADRPRDWWNGEPVANRTVDTAYVDRDGPIEIEFATSGMQIRVTPSDNLSCTVVYVPTGEGYFCVEPVSHATDAINRADEGMKMLAPGEKAAASMHIQAASA